mmetsp:Transcript_27135/g.43583  ORF Transcript_27135/g.43583 Transcript_27135/m.43583 type:complete len:366 (+) Transcript_27135:69-1166(+)
MSLMESYNDWARTEKNKRLSSNERRKRSNGAEGIFDDRVGEQVDERLGCYTTGCLPVIDQTLLINFREYGDDEENLLKCQKQTKRERTSDYSYEIDDETPLQITDEYAQDENSLNLLNSQKQTKRARAFACFYEIDNKAPLENNEECSKEKGECPSILNYRKQPKRTGAPCSYYKTDGETSLENNEESTEDEGECLPMPNCRKQPKRTGKSCSYYETDDEKNDPAWYPRSARKVQKPRKNGMDQRIDHFIDEKCDLPCKELIRLIRTESSEIESPTDLRARKRIKKGLSSNENPIKDPRFVEFISKNTDLTAGLLIDLFRENSRMLKTPRVTSKSEINCHLCVVHVKPVARKMIQLGVLRGRSKS